MLALNESHVARPLASHHWGAAHFIYARACQVGLLAVRVTPQGLAAAGALAAATGGGSAPGAPQELLLALMRARCTVAEHAMIAWQHGGSWFAGCGVWSSVRWCRHRSLGSAHSLHGQQLEDSDVHAGTLPTYPYQHDKRAAPAPQTGAGGNSARAPLQGHARRPRRGRGAARRRAYGRCCGACRPRCCLRRPRLRTRAARAASPPRAVRAARLPRAQWRKRVMSRSWCVGAPAACALALRGEAPGALHVKSGLATQLPSLCQRSVWGDVQPAAASDLGNTAERKQALPAKRRRHKSCGCRWARRWRRTRRRGCARARQWRCRPTRLRSPRPSACMAQARRALGIGPFCL